MTKSTMYSEVRKHSVFSNIPYSIKIVWQEQKSLLLLAAIGTIMRIAAPFTGILLPRIVIDEITGGATPARFIAVMAITAAVLIVIFAIRGYTNSVIDDNIFQAVENRFSKESCEKMLTMDYANMESAHFVRCVGRGWIHGGNVNSSSRFVAHIVNICTNVGGLIFFGGVIALVNPLIILLLVVGAIITCFMISRERRYNKNRWDKFGLWKTQQMMSYVSTIYGDKQNAKDLRLFDMLPWFNQRFDHYLDKMRESNTKLSIRRLVRQMVDNVVLLVRDGAAYAFLVYLMLDGRIELGEFVMVFAAIGGLAYWISETVRSTNTLLDSSLELSYRRELLDFPDVSNTEAGTQLPTIDQPPEICLENVGFTYPNFTLHAEGLLEILENQPPTLEDINITIKPGERIAIVGVNGAGKTTLVKLICGLYKPTTGRILLAGHDISEYNRDDYFGLITAVFQDIFLLAESITENVSGKPPEQTDNTLAATCLRQAGLYDKLKSLPDGADTLLVREVHENATELSGGERQKLALARALYKNAPVLILDEPTAALDPIAEDEMYQQYAEMTRGKTSIYISHRLASTRFCDRILFMDGKRIAEEGSHDELIARGGKYAEMYEIQASYYAKGGIPQ